MREEWLEATVATALVSWSGMVGVQVIFRRRGSDRESFALDSGTGYSRQPTGARVGGVPNLSVRDS
jgi:hypothetical protein